MLAVSGLACVRGERELFASLDFTVAAGECLHVQGENGSGKTSLLRIVCGLAHAAAGEVRWNGEPTRDLGDAWHRDMLYLGHHHAVKDDLTPRENLLLAARLDGDPADEPAVLDALMRLGLQHRVDLPVRHLSQGQRRRVALARLVTRPARLWILDEPFTALDTSAIATIGALIVAHLAAGGLVLLTSHQALDLPGVAPRQLRLVP